MKKLFAIMALVLLLSPILGCAQSTEKVLLIFSYHPEYSWVIEESKGAEDVLRERGVEIDRVYLDTKRKTGADWWEKVAEEAVNRIGEYKPDVVIVFDDNACELVAKRYIGTDLPVVFCGMNGEPADYGFPAQNITGVIERHYLGASIDLLKQLVPGVSTAAFITDDSATSRGFIADLKKSALPVEISEIYATNDFDEWKAKITELQSKVDAIGTYMYHTIKEKGGEESMPPEEVMGWTMQNSKLPDFASSDFTIKDGVLCGVTMSGYEQGKAAAEIAVRILSGEKPADISIMCPQKGIPMINEARAEQLNIEIPVELREAVEIIP